MKPFLGVRHWFDVAIEKSLKRESLMFDQIIINGFSDLMSCLQKENNEVARFYIGELEWLSEQGIITEPQTPWFNLRSKTIEQRKKYKYWDKNIEDMTARIHIQMSEILEKRAHRTLKKRNGNFNSTSRSNPSDLEYFARCYYIPFELSQVSKQLFQLNRANASPILSTNFPTAVSPRPESQVSKTDVVQIVLTSLPVPDESSPWEQIIEYRGDPDTKLKFSALRNWMNEIARATLTLNEVEEKLEWLIFEYKKHLELHRLKTNSGTLQTLLTATAGCLENIIKLNLEKATKGLFALKDRHISLMEQELTAPGREIAYVVKAREHFSA